MEITVIDRQRGASLSRRGLERFLRAVCRECSTRADSLALCLVSDRRMRRLNRQFRGQDRSTDVLSFPGDGTAGPDGALHLGDIVVSVPDAREQARLRGHTLARETRILALHGYLHLLGFDHERDDGEMLRLQRRLARKLLPRRRGPR